MSGDAPAHPSRHRPPIGATGRSASADAALSGAEATGGQQLLDEMIASLPDAAIVLDRDTRVIAFNAAARVIAPALARGAAAGHARRRTST